MRISTSRHRALVCDLDGVVTDTASSHLRAWRQLFDEYLDSRPVAPDEDHSAFTNADYWRYIDGKPRYDGVESFLRARGVSLPRGDPADPPEHESVCGLGNRKNRLFLDRLERSGVTVFDDAVELVRHAQELGLGTAVISASRNCEAILEAAGLRDLFPVRVDGVVAAELGLPGKPDPAVLLEALRRLDVAAGDAVLVEDAQAGVEAGRRGGFGLVIGLDRSESGRLVGHGADVVVADLTRVELHAARTLSDVPDTEDARDRTLRLVQRRRPIVFLDFDGTLSPIVDDPETAAPAPGMRAAVERLRHVCPVAVISGRSAEDVRERLGVDGVWYAGSHGLELVAPNGDRHENEDARATLPALDEAEEQLRERLAGLPGALVERKRFAVSAHHRMVEDEHVGEVKAAVGDVAAEHHELRVAHGRRVVELRPAIDWDKGKALTWLLELMGERDEAVPVYAGDDLTDEDAFAAIRDTGLGIVVLSDEQGDRTTEAHFAVDDPDELRDVLDRIARVREGQPPVEASRIERDWSIEYVGFEPGEEGLREALTTVGNGYLATRGAAPESTADGVHYPGTYVAGLYNRLSSEIGGREITNESLVNLPNWLSLTFRVENGPWFDLRHVEILEYRHALDLRSAVLTRQIRFRDDGGRTTAVTQRRFAAMHLPHVCALETTIAAEDWSGLLEVRAGIDGSVENGLVERYRDLPRDHIEVLRSDRVGDDAVLLEVETNQSHVRVAMAARTRARRDSREIDVERRTIRRDEWVGQSLGIPLERGAPVTIEKIVTVFTGRDRACSEPAEEAVRWITWLGDFESLLSDHVIAWRHLWERFHFELVDGGETLPVLRLHLVHLLQTVSPNTVDLDVGIPPRGLHGEAYRGHILWDEVFILPMLTLHLPALARSLLRYRHRRLPEARRAARAAGYAGAMYPWQSGSDGREESQQLHLNPLSGRWNPDPTHRQRHVGSAVAYNVWHYYQSTGDLEFLAHAGAEMLFEIARFWASIASYDRMRARYVIRGVIGPDEFHTGYPGGDETGVDNNAYTNVMAVWVLLRAFETLEVLPDRVGVELRDRLALHDDELERWEQITRHMYVPFDGDGIVSQFEGYEQLEEFDWTGYRHRYPDIQRLDRLLEAENDSVNRYKASKQADVLMLFYLLSADELRELLARLGYELRPESIPRTIDYYLERTSHGSTLSSVVHAWVLARAHRESALELFVQALRADVADIQGGTTPEGIHLAAMTGSIDLLLRCFSGLELRHDRLLLNPFWPESLGTLCFDILYRQRQISLRIAGKDVEVAASPSMQSPIEVGCRGEIVELDPGARVEFSECVPRSTDGVEETA